MEFLHRTWAEIDVDALVHNFGIIKKEAAGAKIMAVVKADAYGHSARNAARLRYNQAYSYFGLYAC